MKVLVTGGAGFIGQHLCRALLGRGLSVRVIDNFSPQIHGGNAAVAADLAPAVELIRGDIRDKELLIQALDGVDRIVHLAAETGTGQSMYEIERYFSVNVQGTAALLDVLQNHAVGASVRLIVVASSRAVYGEGAFSCARHGVVYPAARMQVDLTAGLYEPRCPSCQEPALLLETDESAPFRPMSIYGLTKQVQEQMVLMFARTKGISGFGLRYQNVYGPGQSLHNPYTGILAVFSNLARTGRAIEVYEDGAESRDFVYVHDVVNATVRAITYEGSYIGPLNVGSGVATSVSTVAAAVNRYFGDRSTIRISGAFRIGDIRHNKACLQQAAAVLGYQPSVSFEAGLKRFLVWAEKEEAGDAHAYEKSVDELASKGLMGAKGT